VSGKKGKGLGLCHPILTGQSLRSALQERSGQGDVRRNILYRILKRKKPVNLKTKRGEKRNRPAGGGGISVSRMKKRGTNSYQKV